MEKFQVVPRSKFSSTFQSDMAGSLAQRYAWQAKRSIVGKVVASLPAGGARNHEFPNAAYNYVEFIMQIVQEPVQLEDGRAVMASVVNLNNEPVTSNRRMIFMHGTPPDTALDTAKVGQRLHVLGVPRISLNAIRNQNLSGNHSLPYEMIIVAVYES